MSSTPSAATALKRWAVPVPDMGPDVYQLTQGPREHKHTYHVFSPWSPDQSGLLLTRYDRVDPEADVCRMDTASGAIDLVGRSRSWTSHTAAFPQWQGADRVFYHSADDGGPVIVTANTDGTDKRVLSRAGLTAWFCAPDGAWVYGATSVDAHFQDDAIADRGDKGIVRMNLETGERELLFSMARAVDVLPDADRLQECHLYAKMILLHSRRPRILFNLTNTFWDRDGTEPRVRRLITVGVDGSLPAYLGRCHHHPNWHPIEDCVVANVKDFNDEVRFGLYCGDGTGLLEYVPQTRGSGHPSFSPDGSRLCTDGSGPRGEAMILCDPSTGNAVVAAEYKARGGGGYPSFKAIDERAPGETVLQALARGLAKGGETWQTQSHPAWSRDGSAIVFNVDRGEGSQVYMVDVEQVLT